MLWAIGTLDTVSLGTVSIPHRGWNHIRNPVGRKTKEISCVFVSRVFCQLFVLHKSFCSIQCSRKSYSLLREQAPEIKIVCRGAINVKGKGGMITYWVNEEPPEQSPRMTKGKRVRIAERSPTVEPNEFRNYLRENMSISSRDSASILGEV